MKSESPAIQTLWQIQFLPTARRCFTLIELLVVIAMIAMSRPKPRPSSMGTIFFSITVQLKL